MSYTFLASIILFFHHIMLWEIACDPPGIVSQKKSDSILFCFLLIRKPFPLDLVLICCGCERAFDFSLLFCPSSVRCSSYVFKALLMVSNHWLYLLFSSRATSKLYFSPPDGPDRWSLAFSGPVFWPKYNLVPSLFQRPYWRLLVPSSNSSEHSHPSYASLPFILFL